MESARFAAMAREYTGCEVWQQDFLKLDLPPASFDGVFANAALFHVPSQELPRVLGELRATLNRAESFSARIRTARTKKDGTAADTAPTIDRDVAPLRSSAGFVELAHYYRPAGLPREQQPWLATVWRKAEPAADDAPIGLS